jgi:hypothetical protein
MPKGLNKEVRRKAGLWIWRFALIAIILSPALSAVNPPERPISENEVKAAFVFNFARFTEWPGNALPNPDSPIVIGVLGNNGFATMLENIVKGKTIQSHPILVQSMKMPADFSGCHIIFISSYEQRRTGQIAESVREMPILTITETEKNSRSKGLVNLLVEEGKVHFEVDFAGVAKSKLKISSKLLRLANASSE